MSKIRLYKYNYPVCPHCKSKRIYPVHLSDMTGEYQKEIELAEVTGSMCRNCDRYHKKFQEVWKYDRAEMKRDIKKLQKFLAEGK